MNTRNRAISIVIADDHAFFRAGFRKIMERQAANEIKFLSEASNGLELIEKVQIHRPDVVITDIKMPAMDGIQATRIIKNEYPNTGIIALSYLDQESYILDMINAGANGYITKDSAKEEVLEAVQTAREGKYYYCSSISEKVYRQFSNSNKQKAKVAEFSFQEIKVIHLICKELTTKEIAKALGLTARTVEDYRSNIQKKIGAKKAVGIVSYAITHNIVTLGVH